MAENPCPVLANGHRMEIKGQAPRVEDSNGNKVTELVGGNFYQCSGCREYIVTSGYPHFPGWYVGYYITQGGIISGRAQGSVWVFTINKNLMRYSQTTSLPGFKFV
ncbi:hypothetical protein [Paenibacillus massiliensis]|uniref:hypothetical protein n=1 Tax=Paenibacillus massiliensis TaxID=225917 RepID=UPI00048EF904|nr:hypothetical protein [Paenibacillus massiliensis]